MEELLNITLDCEPKSYGNKDKINREIIRQEIKFPLFNLNLII